MEIKNQHHQNHRRGRAQQRAKSHRQGGNDSIHDQNAAEAKPAQRLNDERLHAEIAGKQRQQIKSGMKSIQPKGNLKHQR